MLTAALARRSCLPRLPAGLDKLGFQYVNLDGGWQGGRYANGTVRARWGDHHSVATLADENVDPTRSASQVYENFTKFPSGIANLATYVHGLGLKFGSYTDRGTSTCDGRVGSQGHEAADAATYARFGADFVKEVRAVWRGGAGRAAQGRRHGAWRTAGGGWVGWVVV